MSDCATCGTNMTIYEEGQTTHPMCEPGENPVSALTESVVMAALGVVEISAYARRTDISQVLSAIWYAEKLRWPVFPLVPRGKKPLTEHGFKDATLDLAALKRTFSRRPDANLGVPTGAVEHGGCGYDVIDVDGAVGHATLLEMLDGLPPIRAIAFTPGDPTKDNGEPGRHLYIDATGDGNSTRFAPGIDYRGRGGYVVVAPSMSLHGVRYCWLQPPTVP